MKFTISKSELLDVLSKIQGLTGRRSNLAITECVLLKAGDNNLQLTATDLETSYQGEFPAVVSAPGTMAISARKFFEIVREYPSPEIAISGQETQRVSVGQEKVQYHLMAMNPADFPPLAVVEEVDFFEVEALTFRKMIDKSIIILGVGEDKKAHINGVYMELRGDGTPPLIRMVSTDGSRLSKFDMIYDGQAKLPSGVNVLIPKKGLHEVSKFLGSGGKVKVGLQGPHFVLKGQAETLSIRLLEGQFPNYAEIVLREDGHIITMEKEPLLNMLKRMSILCTDSYRAAIFTFDNQALTINATNPDIGESKEDMAIQYAGERFEAAFNPRFFIDAVSAVEDEKLNINIQSEERPCLIEGREDRSFLSAIMPMRV